MLGESGKPNPTTTFTYDAYGNVWTAKDPLGQASNAVTTVTYDATYHAFPIAIVNAAGHRTEFDYTKPAICSLAYPAGSGAVQAMRTPNGVADGTSTRRCFDEFGRVVREAAPGGLADTVWTYDDTPGAVWVKESRLIGGTNRRDSTTYLDGLGRTIQTSTGGPQGKSIVQGRAYDAAGRLQSIAAPHFSGDPAQASSFSYDPLDRLTQEVLPGSGRTWTTAYDRGLVTIRDPNGNHVEQQSSPFGDIVSVREHDTASYLTEYAYRGDGQLRRVTDARSNVTIVGYDLLGRKRSLEDPDSGTTTYDYDANGNLTKRTDSAGVTDWTYDGINRPKTRKLGGIQDVTWSYDSATHGIGMFFQQVDAAGTHRVPAYDTMGRVSTETYIRDGKSFGFTTFYDGLSQADRRVFPNGKFIDFNQDVQGYVTATASGSAAAVSGVEWDARGRLKKWTAGNGVTQTTAFDPATGRLSGIEVKPAAAAAIDSHTYTFDPGDLLKRIDEQQPTTQPRTFGYDSLNRLTWATGPYPTSGTTLSYGYDSIGNLTCKDAASLVGCTGSQAVAATFPASGAARPHAPLSVNGQTAGYGPTGNLQTLGARTYGYDVLGQLKTVRDGGTLLATYGYDAAGSRAKVTDTAGPRPSLMRQLIRPDFEWDATRALAKVHLDLGGTRVATATDAYTPPAGAATPLAAPLPPPWTRALGGAPIAAAALLLLLQLAQRRRQRLPLARPALAGAVVVALLTSWAQPALASLPDGDLNGDGRVDAADILLAQRMATGTLAYDDADIAHGDVAPLAIGDAQISPGDVVVLLRGIRGDDVDGDGVALATELAQGSSAFRADSDLDGWADDVELAAGTDPSAADTDDDGFPDPSDASPLHGVLYTYE